MKQTITLICLAALALMPVMSRAQMTYTSSNKYVGGDQRLNTITAIQTFRSFSSLTDVSWTLNNNNNNASNATFNGYIAQWSGTGIVANTLAQIGSQNIAIGANTSGVLDFSGLSLTLNPNYTYALILSYASGPGSFATTLGANPADSFFGSGGTTKSSITFAGTPNFQSALESATFVAPNKANAYAMSIFGTFTPVPEPKAAAAGLAVLFVAALAGRRVWQRRHFAVVPVAVRVD